MHKVFGIKEDVSYIDREGAYLIPIKDGLVGVVQTSKGYFLLGGGLDDGESHADCIKRECLEEIGYDVLVKDKVCSAEMFFEHSTIGYFHPIQTYYVGELLEQKNIPVEEDHKLVWLEYDEVVGKMYIEMQNWALEKCHMEMKTNRLYIRTLRETDWVEMKNIFVDFNNSKYAIYDMPLPTEDNEAKELTKRFAESNLFFAVYELDKKNMIGYVCFHKNEEQYDLGYCFHSAYHSKGYAYESTKALIEYFVKEYDAKSFTAGTAIDNIPSCSLLEKLGFICVSTEEVSFDHNFSFQGGNFVLNL